MVKQLSLQLLPDVWQRQSAHALPWVGQWGDERVLIVSVFVSLWQDPEKKTQQINYGTGFKMERRRSDPQSDFLKTKKMGYIGLIHKNNPNDYPETAHSDN